MIRILLPAALCLFALGCSEQPPAAPAAQVEPAEPPAQSATEEVAAAPPSAIDENGPVDLDANVDMPAGFETATVETGECMAPVDYFNEKPVVPGPYAAGGDVVATGWNITSSKDDPVPAAIIGVFKPYDGTMKGALLTGERTLREDVAGDNKEFAMAGFRLAGKFPATAGKYRFYIRTGSKDSLTECDSKLVIEIK